MADLKLTFQQRCLEQYMQMVKDAMKASARKNKVGITNEGVESIAYTAIQQGTSSLGKLSFKEYLRMVDMGAGRGHPLGGLTTMKITLSSSHKEGFGLKKDNTRKPKKIYSKVAYGKLTWLNNKLLYGYTEATIASLKKELENESNSITN